jgi:transcriptional regulator with XRE-family HTH domain
MKYLTLAEARKEMGYTWRDCCKIFDIALSSYQNLEKGIYTLTQRKQYDKIKEYYKQFDIELLDIKCKDYTLKGLRKFKGLTQQDMAEILGVTRVTYVNWENGKRAMPIESYYFLLDYFKDIIVNNNNMITGLAPICTKGGIV